MMIHAYPEMYVSKAQRVLGDAFHYAINILKMSGDDFIKLFLGSSISKEIQNGDPKYLVGKSGIELVFDIIYDVTGRMIDAQSIEVYERSKEYWIGWAVSYYQWYSDRKFSEIFQAVPFNDLKLMYHTLHEADISKFVDIVETRMKEYFTDTNLKRHRTHLGYTQLKLAKKSNVSLRSIQMYEQRNKDINKASAETIYRLAKALSCSMEDLLEK